MSEQWPRGGAPKVPSPMQRRGLLAALAALLAGLLARAASRVEAQTASLVLNQQNLSTAVTELAYNGTAGNPTLLIRNPAFDGLQSVVSGALSYGVLGDNATGFGVVGTSNSGVGVSGGSSSGTGLSGDSASGWGVAGYSDAATLSGGVYGEATGANSPQPGVYGKSPNGPGVSGQSTSGHGVSGQTSATGGTYAGVYGAAPNYSVYGSATTGYGVAGNASSNGTGLYGSSTNGLGVRASSTNYMGLYATGPSTGYAARFDGPVLVNGPFTVMPLSGKSCAVPFPDGSLHLMYCMESPENWFEDFGSASLTSGRATVPLEPNFASVVLTDNYHVFLTPLGSSNGLYVSSKTEKSFVVQEQGNGTSSVPFSYRVVAKRKDFTPARFTGMAALAPVQLPTVPAPTPRAAAADSRALQDPLAPAPVQPPGREPRRGSPSSDPRR